MAIDKLKKINKTKWIILLIWLAYAFVYNSKFGVNLPLSNIKDKLEINEGIALIGGSNVQLGLSAELVSNDFYKCVNFGLSSEKGSFSEYINYLDGKIISSHVIYSPAYIWSETPMDRDDSFKKEFFKLSKYIPTISIFSQIKEVVLPSSSLIEFNSFGDQVGYSCSTKLSSFKIDQKKFKSSSNAIIEELIGRVEKIKNITGANKILIRIPPVYAKENEKKFISENMRLRIEALKSTGISVIGETIVSSDKSLFCDNFHPNEKGREFFSMELKNAVKKLNIDFLN